MPEGRLLTRLCVLQDSQPDEMGHGPCQSGSALRSHPTDSADSQLGEVESKLGPSVCHYAPDSTQIWFPEILMKVLTRRGNRSYRFDANFCWVLRLLHAPELQIPQMSSLCGCHCIASFRCSVLLGCASSFPAGSHLPFVALGVDGAEVLERS